MVPFQTLLLLEVNGDINISSVSTIFRSDFENVLMVFCVFHFVTTSVHGNQHIYINYLNNSNKHLIHLFMYILYFKMTDGYSIR
jgi:hypothetical protein